MQHELDNRTSFFPELMEHVRLPLVSKQFILEKVVDDSLIKNSPKCMFFNKYDTYLYYELMSYYYIIVR